MDKIASSFSLLRENLNPIANQISKDLGKGFGQVKQYAQEKFGTAEDVTDLPPEYKELEKKIDAVYKIHVTFLKLMKHDSAILPVLGETFTELTRTVKETLPLDSRSPSSPTLQSHPHLIHPQTFSHAIAGASLQSAEIIGVNEPLGKALEKYGIMQEKIGDAKLQMNEEMKAKFTVPYQATLNNNLQFAMRARRTVQAARLHLDAVKSRFKSAPTQKIEQVREDLEAAEDSFVTAVEEAQSIMKRCIEDPEPLRGLSDLVNAQLKYYKVAAELLSDLAPEIDEIQVNQESLYRNQLP